jgi:CheY-like chemotaxis protein
MSKSSYKASAESFTKDETGEMPASLTLEGLQVLLVEDEPDISELFVFVLEGLGADIVRATSAAEALIALENSHPDILLCNLKLPDLDGFNLIQQIRRQEINPEELPAIAISSYTREYSREAVLNAGFQLYLPKPIDPEELGAEILRFAKQKVQDVEVNNQ